MKSYEVYRKGRKTVGAIFMTAMCFFLGSRSLSLQAAPATLTSADAAVYEQADEGSSQIGNLVEGSSFEYIGDVTAADGSIWHQITMSDGVNGYIRGDREMEIRTEEAAGEGQGEQGTAPEEGGDTPAENEAAAGGVEADAQENRGNGNEAGEASGENENPEENEELEENETVAAVGNMQNNQEKKYVLDSSAKIKEREGSADSTITIVNKKGIKERIDKALLMGMAVVLFCTVTVYICLARIRMLNCGINDGRTLEAGKEKLHRKIEKKKRRKVKKAVKVKK